MNKPLTEHPKLLLDPYGSWAAQEGVPVVEDFGVDLIKVATAPWPRFGVEGAIVNLKGRGDFVSIFVLDLAPGATTAPQRHLYEEVVYVLSGFGSTTVEFSDGRTHAFEWGPKSLFALPLNARYQHFNTSGKERVRLASTNNLAMMLNLFHNEAFVFDNDYEFPERQGAQKSFGGEGEFIPVRPGRNMWETNFVPDLAAFELKAWEARGAGGSNMMFVLADGTMHAHVSQMPVGTYKKGAPSRLGLPCLCGDRPRLFVVVVRYRQRSGADRLAARGRVRAARPDVPSAFQHVGRSGALPCGRLRRAALSFHAIQAARIQRHGRQRARTAAARSNTRIRTRAFTASISRSWPSTA